MWKGEDNRCWYAYFKHSHSHAQTWMSEHLKTTNAYKLTRHMCKTVWWKTLQNVIMYLLIWNCLQAFPKTSADSQKLITLSQEERVIWRQSSCTCLFVCVCVRVCVLYVCECFWIVAAVHIWRSMWFESDTCMWTCLCGHISASQWGHS